MPNKARSNEIARECIKRHEGLVLTAYRDVAGIWTIGYGHTGPDVFEGRRITEAEADALLEEDMDWACRAVDRCVAVPLTAHQRAALVCFTYNIGEQAFRSSTLLRRLNMGDYAAVPAEMMRWVHAGGERVAGLVNRRKAEIALWQTPDAAEPAPVVAQADLPAPEPPPKPAQNAEPQGPLSERPFPSEGLIAALARFFGRLFGDKRADT